MPWKVRFRGKDFVGDEGWDPETEYEIRPLLTDKVPGSVEFVFLERDDAIDDVTIHASADRGKFPFTGLHGEHPELGEVFIFYGVPDEGEGQLIALYSNDVWPDHPFNDYAFTGDGS